MVSMHGCIRVFKESHILQNAGHTVHHMAMSETFGWNKYETHTLYGDFETGVRVVQMYDRAGIDVFHVHNEPDWIVTMVRRGTDKPIVYDIHDLEHLRHAGGPDEHELNAVRDCDAVIHTSKYTKAKYDEAHGEKEIDGIVLPKVPSQFLVPEQMAAAYAPHTLVYQGGLSEVPQREYGSDGVMYENYRYYVEMVAGMAMNGFQSFLFSASPLQGGIYEGHGAIVFPAQPWIQLLKAISPYQIGFVGATTHCELMEYSSPNKLFEYVSAGVVPVVMYAKHAAEITENYDFGIVLDVEKPIQGQLDQSEILDKREKLLKVRNSIVMESELPVIEGIYKQLLS
jgi:hypothetical protein